MADRVIVSRFRSCSTDNGRNHAVADSQVALNVVVAQAEAERLYLATLRLIDLKARQFRPKSVAAHWAGTALREMDNAIPYFRSAPAIICPPMFLLRTVAFEEAYWLQARCPAVQRGIKA